MIRQRALALLAGMALFAGLVTFIVVALITSWWLGLIAGLLVALAVGAFVYLRRDTLALSGIETRPLLVDEHPHVGNLVDGLCVANGFDRPILEVLDSRGFNGLAVGSDSRDSRVVLTTGLLRNLDRLETEGVLSHLLTMSSSPDIGGLTLTAAILATIPVTRVGQSVLEWILPEHFRIDTDLAAVGYTRYPPGFLSSLEKFQEGTTVVSDARLANAHLWLADPIGDPAVVTERIHPPLHLRVSVLREH
ncbi:MAG: hypothetical protein V3V01_15505 [Acidimicrobiales bacterium]